MRRTLVWRYAFLAAVAMVLVVAGGPSGAQAPTAEQTAGKTRTTWYFYKVRWGFQDEFLDLFQKNHYPVLTAMREAGAFTSIRAFTPRYHGDGRADWTFAVELVAREDFAGTPEAEVVRKLYPDQETFRKEERRRFELLEAHWDVPLETIDFETR